jgi:3-isopropylmalate/(R)-2-methylmalate dehydratase small subunit
VSTTREPITRFDGAAVAIARDNIDTDQVIPARFLKTTTRAGLGAHLFEDWRRHADGTPRAEFILNQPAAAGASILVAGWNFGCGSSREHAPWALVDFGFRAVVAPSFADIFRQNALKNGLLPVQLAPDIHVPLLEQVVANPGTVVGVDLVRQVVRLPDGREVSFDVDSFARECLLKGVDEIGYVLARGEAIARFESSRASSRW